MPCRSKNFSEDSEVYAFRQISSRSVSVGMLHCYGLDIQSEVFTVFIFNLTKYYDLIRILWSHTTKRGTDSHLWIAPFLNRDSVPLLRLKWYRVLLCVGIFRYCPLYLISSSSVKCYRQYISILAFIPSRIKMLTVHRIRKTLLEPMRKTTSPIELSGDP
jgi:hypothetical protein